MQETPAEPARLPLVGRLAPSPTGYLHVGHARSFALAWAGLRARGGRVVLRIEDLDGSRVRPEFIDAILYDLEWLGLDWDGAWRLQSHGRERLVEALGELERQDLVYPCICSRSEVRQALSAPHERAASGTGSVSGAGEALYPGTCRGRFAGVQDAREQSAREPALRFATRKQVVRMHDLLHGALAFDAQGELGDFVVARRDGSPAYQLAVVVDDAADGVTEVVRGDDLLPSTGRQFLLQEALGLAHPSWGHLPLVQDDQGERLAKRSGGLTLRELRAAGVEPARLLAWIGASAGFQLPQREPSGLSPAELTEGFCGWGALPLAPVRFGESERRALQS